MRIDQFEYLVDIYKTRSITKTAEKFFISRQVVSHAIRSLEDEIGEQLLVRNRGGYIEFTTVGEVAAQKAQGIVDAYREFLVSVANFSTREVATSDETVLTILSIPRLVSLLIPAVTAQYRKASPEISFQVISQSSEEILKNFPHTANAIGFISYQDYAHGDMEPFQSATYPDLTVYPFLESQFYICMNQHSRYNTKSFFTGEDLEELPLISYEPALGQLANYKDAKLNVTSTVNDLRTLSSFIKQDLGVGLLTLSEYNSLPDAKKFIVKPVRSNTNLNLYFAYVLNQESNENANLQQFASMLVNHFSNKI